jgi:hypothetical protein
MASIIGETAPIVSRTGAAGASYLGTIAPLATVAAIG